MLKLTSKDLPPAISQLKPAVENLYCIGANPQSWLNRPRLAIVGCRKPTIYGQEVTRRLSSELAGMGVVIISGLALGVDGIVHRSAINAGGTTVAVLPTAVDKTVPTSHSGLANDILSSGGGIVSEFAPGHKTLNFKYTFVVRNRIIAGLANAVLITEAATKSGSLYTAYFALDLGLPVLAVPGSIYSSLSDGPNQLIKSGAHLVNNSKGVLDVLGYHPASSNIDFAKTKLYGNQLSVFELLRNGLTAQDELAEKLLISSAELASTLTILEINGYIRPLGNGQWVAI